MSKMKDNRRENNPLLAVYMKILPATVLAVVVIFCIVKLITGLTAPEQIVLNVNYRDFEMWAEIQGAMSAATDEAFENELKYVEKKESGFYNIFDFFNSEEGNDTDSAEDGNYTFTFETKEMPSVIYVKSPEWWYPIDTDGSIELSLENGAETEPVTEAGGFKITNIETVKISTGVFNVNVTMSATKDAVPSDIKLIMDDHEFEEWDGSTEVTYDEATGFAERTVVFRFNRGNRDDISDLFDDAKIVVDEYTVRKKYTVGEISSNVDGLEIVVCD